MIKISDNGKVSISDKVMMRDFEIAELFGTMLPTVRTHIRALLKSGVIIADLTGGGTWVNQTILPDYYGLDMIMALVFRVHSRNAEIFRNWVLKKVTESMDTVSSPILISINDKENCRFMN